MISAWNLLWIVPMSASLGAFCMALAAVNNIHKEYEDDYE